MQDDTSPDVLVIGSGPAGLAAAEALCAAGRRVWIADQKPSFGRKFLMAGKSGLNLTKDTTRAALIAANSPGHPALRRALEAWGAEETRAWAEGLGQETFVGPSGRVFPKAMKASPLLRAWLARLSAHGAIFRTGWRWEGALSGEITFSTADGPASLRPKALVLALGGASWPRLGSDGRWAAHLPHRPFAPANMGFDCAWSPHMASHFGAPIKNVLLSHGEARQRGEFVLTERGIEGGAVYALSAPLREALVKGPAILSLDLFPDLSEDALSERLLRPRGKSSLSNYLRKTIGLQGARAALARECFGPALPKGDALARELKAVPLRLLRPRPLPEAISTAGGLSWEALDDDLMLRAHPGTFAAGEMLDWEAPTGGYLITTCIATGRQAGQAAHRWLSP